MVAAVPQPATVGVAGGVDEGAQLIKFAPSGIELAKLLLGWVRCGHAAGWFSNEDAQRAGLRRRGDAAIRSFALVQATCFVTALFVTGVVDAVAQIVYFVP
jgi:hypothetical protein